MSDRLLALCPVCHGCGRTSINPNTGGLEPQPTWTDSGTSAQGWTKCVRCEGGGVIVISHKEWEATLQMRNIGITFAPILAMD